ncbi:LacI family DNA-binding transcriptional regulator [Jiangella alba]|uniref:Transcriptional regulator, LacI family n=1 Tax=Jiangella alba TaxID=561176 RepID=A0A1H5MXP6_9ACTN|nr:LacI family DNA-binding transcriptional regulator [Jiangella alba]SEE94139.1 transcriptional regulator, LacI family [Jiangella alba]
MATIYDVAAAAGLSIGTVSRFLNEGYVSAASRRKIERAISELGFVPSGAARTLSTKKSRLIGFVVSDMSNPFSSELAKAVQERADELDYCAVTYGTNHDDGRARRGIETLRGHGVDGLVVGLPESAPANELLRSVAEQGIPLVLVGMRVMHPNCDRVSTDTYDGAMQAMDHLIDLGHERIGFIGAADQGKGRRRAFVDALTRTSSAIDPELIVEGPLTREGGLEGASRLLSLDRPPTAIFATNDVMALGVYEAAYRQGLHVPRDLSVVGFDDIDLARHAVPALTTVSQPKTEMGHEAVRLLEARLTAETPPSSKETLFRCGLVVRDSTAPPS